MQPTIHEINKKVTDAVVYRTEVFTRTFTIDKTDFVHEAMGEIVKNFPLISWSGYERMHDLLENICDNYLIVPFKVIDDEYSKALPDPDKTTDDKAKE